MSRRLFTDEQAAEIGRRYLAGESTPKLRDALGLPRENTIRNTLMRLGIPLRRELCERRTTPEQDDEIAALCEQGVSREAACKRFGVSVNVARRIIEERGLQLRQGRPPTYQVDHSAFDALTPESLYWVGFLFADGCVHYDKWGAPILVCALAEKDRGHVEKLRAFMKSTHPIHRIEKTSSSLGGPCARFSLRSERICKALTERGIVSKRTRVPVAELAASRDFWRGAVDGDGWIGCSNGKPFFGLSGQMPLLTTFQEFLAARGLGERTISPTESGIWKVQAGCGPANAIITMLYERSAVALDRKHGRAKEIIAGNFAKSAPYEEGSTNCPLDDTNVAEILDA